MTPLVVALAGSFHPHDALTLWVLGLLVGYACAGLLAALGGMPRR